MLQKTLESLSKLTVPDDVTLTLLVVDNNSTDETCDVIESFKSSPFATEHSFVPLFETRQGHTFSRNCAIEESKGNLILWTDDDVLVKPDWVQRYVDAANEQTDCDFWGSQIEPDFEGGRPEWINSTWDIVQGCFAARDLGDQPVELTAEQLPYGANFAIRGDVQRGNLFETHLGRRANQVLGEDELDLMRRLLEKGHRGSWIPAAVVQHLIPTSRSTREYVYDYFVGQGRAIAAKGECWSDDIAQLHRESTKERRAYNLKRYLARPEVWVSHLVRSALAKGQAEFLSAEAS